MAANLPTAISHPHMTLCSGKIYLSHDKTVFSCSEEDLLKSCKRVDSDSNSFWNRLADIPIKLTHDSESFLATLHGHVLAVRESDSKYPSIHCYSRSTDSWTMAGEMPTPWCRLWTMAALPNNELLVVGGLGDSSLLTEIARLYFLS